MYIQLGVSFGGMVLGGIAIAIRKKEIMLRVLHRPALGPGFKTTLSYIAN